MENENMNQNQNASEEAFERGMKAGMEVAANGKSKVVAAVLAFFLGTLGIHRFYLGRIGSAVAMLVLTIIGVITAAIVVGIVIIVVIEIIAFVDFIRILVGNLQPVNGNYKIG